MDWNIALISFALIFPVELPDKTFVAALVLSTRYKPLAVWIGVGIAFGVQCVVAVTAGTAVSYLPELDHPCAEHSDVPDRRALLLIAAPKADADEKRAGGGVLRQGHAESRAGTRCSPRSCCCSPPSGATSRRSSRSTWSPSTATRCRCSSARGRRCSSCPGLAVIGGRVLLRYMRLSVLHYIASGVCLVFAGVGAYQLVTG